MPEKDDYNLGYFSVSVPPRAVARSKSFQLPYRNGPSYTSTDHRATEPPRSAEEPKCLGANDSWYYHGSTELQEVYNVCIY